MVLFLTLVHLAMVFVVALRAYWEYVAERGRRAASWKVILFVGTKGAVALFGALWLMWWIGAGCPLDDPLACIRGVPTVVALGLYAWIYGMSVTDYGRSARP